MPWAEMLASLLLVAGCSPQRSAPQSGRREAEVGLQALLDEAVSKGVPGISAAVANRDSVVWTGVAGKADLQTGAPVRPELLFGVGSITKTFAAVVILQLAEEKRLSLDSTAASILGAAVQGIPNADRATLAQLLNHTGGVPSWEDDSVWIHEGRGDRLDPSRIWDKAATLRYIKGHAPLAPPGEKFSYANTNYTLLGMVIEKVTGHEAVDEIHRRILTPLGLHDIHLEGFEPVPANQLAHRYHWATPTFRQEAGVNAAFPEVRPGLIDASRSNLSVEWTAGGMVATARDLARYAVALRDGRLLKPESMKFLTTWFPAGEGSQVGHNVFRREYPGGVAVIGHNGDVLGFTGSFYWVEGADAVVAVVANVGSMHSTSAGTGAAPAGKVPGTAYLVADDKRFIALATKVATAK
jgi:D-alanyl-D-alanine carboxypeptidase